MLYSYISSAIRKCRRGAQPFTGHEHRVGCPERSCYFIRTDALARDSKLLNVSLLLLSSFSAFRYYNEMPSVSASTCRRLKQVFFGRSNATLFEITNDLSLTVHHTGRVSVLNEQ